MMCRRAAELIGRSLDAPLPFGQRGSLGVHTLFCGPCRRFRRQLRRMHAACRAADAQDFTGNFGQLSNEARARIASALE